MRMMPSASLFDGLRAIGLSAQASIARRLGWEQTFERANRPVMALSDMQPITAAWWRDRRLLPGGFSYLALGDSTAQGIGASTPGRSYVGQLIERIEAGSTGPVRAWNLAVSGATSSLCARDQLRRAEKPLRKHPDLVTLAIGANDVAEWNPVAFHSNLNRILDVLPPHTIVGELPCFFLPPREGHVRDANRIIRTIADDRGLVVAPLHRATKERGLHGVLTEFAADAFHPNDRGYQVWADAFWPLVNERVTAVLAQRGAPAAAQTGVRSAAGTAAPATMSAGATAAPPTA